MPSSSGTPLQPPGQPQKWSAVCAQLRGAVPGSAAARQQPARPGRRGGGHHTEPIRHQPSELRCKWHRGVARGLRQQRAGSSQNVGVALAHAPRTALRRSFPRPPELQGLRPAGTGCLPPAPCHSLRTHRPGDTRLQLCSGLPTRLHTPRTWGTPRGPPCRESQRRRTVTAMSPLAPAPLRAPAPHRLQQSWQQEVPRYHPVCQNLAACLGHVLVTGGKQGRG